MKERPASLLTMAKPPEKNQKNPSPPPKPQNLFVSLI